MGKFRHSGELIVFLGVLCWSLNAPLIKFIQLDSLFVCGMRSAVAAAVLLPFLRIKKLSWNRWMALYLLSFTGLSITIIYAIRLTDPAIAVGMQYTAIIWLLLIEVIQGAKLTGKQLISLAMIFVGMAVFMASGIFSGSYIGNIIALTEGVFFAGMTLGSRKVSGDNPLGLTAVANLTVALVVFGLLSPSLFDAASLSRLDWTILIILGVVQIGGGHALYNIGLQYVSPKSASVIALWEMILGPLWVAVFLAQYPSPIVIIGLIIILVGMLLNICWSDS